MQTRTVSEAKATLNALVERIADTWEPVTLTRYGKPIVVIQAADDFDAAQEVADWLADPQTLPSVAEADAEIAAGVRGAAVAEVRRELGFDV